MNESQWWRTRWIQWYQQMLWTRKKEGTCREFGSRKKKRYVWVLFQTWGTPSAELLYAQRTHSEHRLNSPYLSSQSLIEYQLKMILLIFMSLICKWSIFIQQVLHVTNAHFRNIIYTKVSLINENPLNMSLYISQCTWWMNPMNCESSHTFSHPLCALICYSLFS